MSRSFLIALTLLFITNIASSQKYNTAVGLRAGDDLGFVLDQRVLKRYTIQLMHESALFSNRIKTSVTARRHYPILSSRFNMYLGAGAMLSKQLNELDVYTPFSPGLQTTAGLELTVGRVLLAADFSPSAVVGKRYGNPRFNASSGISLKYVIWKKKSKTKQKLKKLAFWNRIKL